MQQPREELELSASTKGGEGRGSSPYSQSTMIMDFKIIDYYEKASEMTDPKFR
jgi:hypothetical protein